jgi:tRNA G37 N-methylase Trm5
MSYDYSSAPRHVTWMTGCDAHAGLTLVIETAHAKAVKDALKSARLLDLSRQAQPFPPSSVALPCVAVAHDLAPPEVRTALAAGVAVWRDDVGLASRKQTAAPATALRDAVRVLLLASNLPESLLDDLPHRWERLGDLALLPADCLCAKSWPAPVLEHLFPIAASCLGVKRLARQAPVDPGPRRSSRAVLLWPPGADGWTTVTENSIPLSLDVTQSMFSSGNATEKHRMARLPAAGETVVDLFAGIGYWALPLLVHAKVATLYACEWNPPSIDALRRNLVLNGIPPGSCTVLPGDCREVAPKGIAHRVLLGLLPDAQVGYAAAVEALRLDTGGVLHVHGNVRAGEQATWAESTAAELQRLAAALGGARAHWQARVLHVEVIKSYAPRVLHCVADIRLGSHVPRPEPPLSVMELEAPSAEHMHGTAVASRTPARLTGLDCGPCVQRWSAAYLRAHSDASRTVAVHVSDDAYLTWHPKNFVLRTMTLAELLDMCAAGKHVYMRAVGADPRSEPACLATSFPGLSADVELPRCCLPPAGREVHSTVLRVAAPGMTLWLHYDALDNVLLQLHGTKRLLLFPPSAAEGLYLSGSSSRVPTRLVWLPSGDAQRHAFPLFPGPEGAFEVALSPGQGVFIPRYWAHSVLADPDADISVAVNCFWHPPSGEPCAHGDVYGNADPPAASKALQAAREAAAALAQLPPDAQAFFASVAAGILRS